MLPIPFLKKDDNYIISLIDTNEEYTFSGTYSRDLLDYWKVRINAATGSEFNLYQVTGAASGIPYPIVATGATGSITDNLIGSRWNMYGGDGNYSSEFIYYVSFEMPYSLMETNVYFNWDNDNYINVNTYYDNVNLSTVVNWIVNGATAKSEDIILDFETYPKFKITWNQYTGQSSVYSEIDFSTGYYKNIVGTYSVYSNKYPFIFLSFAPYVNALSYSGLGLIDIICYNYIINGISYSAIGMTSNPPPINLMMGQDDYY